jgi:uncharacterized protein YneF (UPF0154 family)
LAEGRPPLKDDRGKVFLALTFASFVSSTLIVCLTLGYFAGTWIDGRFAVYPAGRAGGVFGGLFLAAWTIAKYIEDNFLKRAKRKKQ